MQKYRTKVPKFSHPSELALKTKDEKLLEILKDFDKFFEKNTQIFEPLIVLKFEEIFLHLSLKDAKFQGFLSEILGEIDKKYAKLFGECDAEFLSVSDMAHFAKSDISTFSKHFKQNFKLPPKKYLDEKRFLKAKDLLAFSTQNINEICTTCGFSSVSWFIKRFKERYGQIPKQFQKTSKNRQKTYTI